MTLKEFCKEMGWERLRRWAEAFEKLRNPETAGHPRLEPVLHEYTVGTLVQAEDYRETGNEWVEQIPAYTWHIPHMKTRYDAYRHKVGEPATAGGKGDKRWEGWYQFNLLHRIDGPAKDGKHCYLDGVYYTPRDWEAEVERRTGTRPQYKQGFYKR